MTPKYTIWDDIYHTIEAGGLSEKGDIAAKVAENVPPNKVRAALLELLPQAVLQAQSKARRIVLAPETQRVMASTGATARLRALGIKNMIVHVPDTDGQFVSLRLGALTADDLMRLAQSYQDRATANRLQGEKYEALAALVSGVVDDVDDDVIRKVLA